MKEIFPLLFKAYELKIFPKIKRVRGASHLRHLLAKLSSLSLKRYPRPKKTILDKKWDKLIVLDACRYDLFTEWFGKNCEYIISVGSHTSEWVKRTFCGHDCSDIVYVSGSPFVSEFMLWKICGVNPFFHLEPVWKYGWNKKLKTVLPREVTKASIKLAKKYPNKKMIIHYIQPHYPFVGKTKLILKNDDTLYAYLRSGKISREVVWEAYLSNLDLVMEDVKKLADKLDGKVVVTSDHGDHLGENNIYGHLPGLRTEELVKVPYVTVDCLF
jgi:hypothetical protein